MAWLVARQRYGFLRLPDGTPQTFSRTHALQSVRYGPVVLVRGKSTGRQWLRWLHDASRSAVRELTDESDLLRPALPEDLDPADERALRALMRAANEPGVQQQVQALSEALENYVAGVDVPKLFSKKRLGELRDLAPTGEHSAEGQVREGDRRLERCAVRRPAVRPPCARRSPAHSGRTRAAIRDFARGPEQRRSRYSDRATTHPG